jgi:hypothetical protein
VKRTRKTTRNPSPRRRTCTKNTEGSSEKNCEILGRTRERKSMMKREEN